MILTDCYIGIKNANTKTSYDVKYSTGSYDHFESLLINKKGSNIGGLSFYLVNRPSRWGGAMERKTDKAITKSTVNISSIIIPDPEVCVGFGDVKNTSDALIFIFSPDWLMIEIFVARGQKNNRQNLYQLVVDGEYEDEIEILRKQTRELNGNQNCIFNCKNPDIQTTE